jgi:hypothetical protein
MRKLFFLSAGILLSFYLNAQDVEFSTSGNEVWYYIQFVNNELVVEQQGVEELLTVATPVKDKEEQIWKVEQSGDDYIRIINKKDPDLQIRYLCFSDADENGYYGAYYGSHAPVETGYELALGDVTGGHVIYRALFSKGYAMLPADNGIFRNKTGEVNYEANGNVHLNFIKPENLFTSIASVSVAKTNVYPNPAKEFVSVEISEGTTAISIANTIGQTVKTVKPTAKVEKIDVSKLSQGVYFLKIEKTSGTETHKVIVTK